MALALSPNLSQREQELETPAELRELARRIRVLASLEDQDEEKRRLIDYAEELERSAAKQERRG
ncbi:MAG: hypothetical protein JSS04_02875 [Proteobacteria bacterium]|nr:hypothetical protein [Pseudomonadota bacterium]